MPRLASRASTRSIFGALSRIAATAVGARVVTPAATVAWSGSDWTVSVAVISITGPWTWMSISAAEAGAAASAAAASKARFMQVSQVGGQGFAEPACSAHERTARAGRSRPSPLTAPVYGRRTDPVVGGPRAPAGRAVAVHRARPAHQ